MKPDWKDMPDWVNWIWIGQTGKWFGTFKKPKWVWILGYWKPDSQSKWGCISLDGPSEWSRGMRKGSLEKRP